MTLGSSRFFEEMELLSSWEAELEPGMVTTSRGGHSRGLWSSLRTLSSVTVGSHEADERVVRLKRHESALTVCKVGRQGSDAIPADGEDLEMLESAAALRQTFDFVAGDVKNFKGRHFTELRMSAC